MTTHSVAESLVRPDGETIAYHKITGKGPGVVFCGGFMSDMTGTKATALEDHCRDRGLAFVRFDYLGHGQSSGDFADKGCISRWVDDAIQVLDALTEGPQIIVGSSMGGWVMLKLALARPDRIRGLVGIAPAPDFTTWMWDGMSPEQQDAIQRDGRLEQATEYGDDPYVITWKLITDGRLNHLLDGDTLPITAPVRLLHGMADPDVPWQHSLRISEKLASNDIRIQFVKSGDHRLSEPDDIAMLLNTVDDLAQTF